MRAVLVLLAALSLACSQHGPPSAASQSPVRTVARAALAPAASLRFSPRPNRAREIPWRTFGPGVFDEARARRVPVVLSLSAVWCHWCHVLDETTLSDPRVIAALRDRAIPVRVDADQNPDVERRYILGGWPTLALLDADGFVITGSTYTPAERFMTVFEAVAHAMAMDAAGAFGDVLPENEDDASPAALPDDLPDQVARELLAHEDVGNGGWLGGSKFPDGAALVLLATGSPGNANALHAAERLLRGTIRLSDPVEGGFFRYAMSRDWSMPHYEKMLATNAELIDALATCATALPEGVTVARRAIDWAHAVMFDAQHGVFAASQDADEAYYALATREARAAHTAPYVDRTPIAALNARMGRALLVAGEAFADPVATELGLHALRYVRDHMRRADGAIHHAIAQDTPALEGDLSDAAWAVRGFVRAANGPDRDEWLAAARTVIEFAERDLAAPTGGFYDRPGAGEESPRLPGLMAHRWRPLALNVVMAQALAEFARVASDRVRATEARRTLATFGGAWHGRVAHEAEFALAFEAVRAAELAEAAPVLR